MSTINIHRFDGPDESTIMATWEDGEWTKKHGDARFIDDKYVQAIETEEELYEHFDGPYLFAAPADEDES